MKRNTTENRATTSRLYFRNKEKLRYSHGKSGYRQWRYRSVLVQVKARCATPSTAAHRLLSALEAALSSHGVQPNLCRAAEQRPWIRQTFNALLYPLTGKSTLSAFTQTTACR